MKLYQTQFNFEITVEDNQCPVFPSLKEARSHCLDILKDSIKEQEDAMEQYGSEYQRKARDLSAEIFLVEVPPMNVKMLCEIINSNGGGYVRSKQTVMLLAVAANAKRVHTYRTGKVGTR